MLLGQGVANLVISGALFFVLVKSFGLGNEFKDSTAGSPYTNNVATKGEPPTENAFQNEGEDQDHDQEQQQQAKGKSSSATRPISDDISVSAAKNRAQQSDLLCPCQSGIRYPECCGKYHTQSLANASGDAQFMRFPETASGVLRARFSAFALGDVDYIIRTTSTSNEDYINPQEDKEGFTMWRYSIKKFCRKYGFVGLTILNEQYFDVISSQGLGDRLLNWMNEMITPSSKHFDSPASNTASNDYSSNRPSKRVARILFRANMLVDGVPVYFIEDAKFVREGPNWKYASGTLVSGSE